MQPLPVFMAFAYILHNAIDAIDMENMLAWAFGLDLGLGFGFGFGHRPRTKYSPILNSARIQHTFA